MEQRVGTGPDLHDLDEEIRQVRREKEAAIDVQDFETAAMLRDKEARAGSGRVSPSYRTL